ncbi:LytTR family DNA-binding domain-containing protein [Microbacterium sp. zg.Y625]|uniref:LytR/AlgR family response regulator transcription factor n=1 Tax=Microbacterium jiangjiandongii TaxID=3049071 RepID=UPI00214C21F6|nr:MULTISPECIES: LytTR family DNA-binding domain-containing protein [unclassified Microbacterium]MCR2794111.1 LytTR family DNA-binding domain-containing protein [Microbacterium sp. zg.Y625]MCR2816325.1 LytTR family DNA-binding domain-containing protein [Microbacterium sp. zg.Y843]WIM25593.1 LytTR family DNA-binding domain-containing protein [Microbacterium sp. zg-Y625]
MIDVVVADGEPSALAELVRLLGRDERIGAVHTASSGPEVLRLLEERPVAAAFLEIDVPGLSGLDLARAFERYDPRPAVVFVTADDARAVEAFDVRALDYVLKPARPERLRRAVDRIIAAAPVIAEADETVPVTVGPSVRLVRRSEVRWVRAEGDYSRLWTPSGGHLVRIPISELEHRWGHAGFVRVHRSYLVHRHAVLELRLAGPAPTIVLAEIEIPVSRRLAPAVRERLVRQADSRG